MINKSNLSLKTPKKPTRTLPLTQQTTPPSESIYLPSSQLQQTILKKSQSKNKLFQDLLSSENTLFSKDNKQKLVHLHGQKQKIQNFINLFNLNKSDHQSADLI